jgi:hypothetical protein
LFEQSNANANQPEWARSAEVDSGNRPLNQNIRARTN